ncbi:unnamed protein product [Anisakis simplex]|uniref:Transmembrane protein n=1 Tax=Anisakis simplex TaxID=6269 RepID=A0A0M3J8M7_ANISI|nr:unnamed protein product [Anisakis simplex]
MKAALISDSYEGVSTLDVKAVENAAFKRKTRSVLMLTESIFSYGFFCPNFAVEEVAVFFGVVETFEGVPDDLAVAFAGVVVAVASPSFAPSVASDFSAAFFFTVFFFGGTAGAVLVFG